MTRFVLPMTLVLAATFVWASAHDASARKGKTSGVTSCSQSSKPSQCSACVNDGNNWIEGQGCLDKACTNGDRVYEGGDTINTGGRMYMCNGLTGNWEQIEYGTRPPKRRPHTIPRPDQTAPAKPRPF